MYEDYEGSELRPDQLIARQVPRSTEVESPSFTERRTMNRWQFRADQIQLLYQQVQTELIISMLVAAIVSTVFRITSYNVCYTKLLRISSV